MNMKPALKNERFFALVLKGFRQLSYGCSAWKLRWQVRSLGKGAKILKGVIISGGRNIRIGGNCFIGRNVLLDGRNGEIVIGDNVEIRDNVRIYSKKIQIGSGATIGEGSFLSGVITLRDKAWISRSCDLAGTIDIEQAILGPQVSIVGGVGHQRDPKTKRIVMSQRELEKPPLNLPDAEIRILSGSWVGQRAVILKGITIGHNSVVGAGSVVTKSIPQGSVVAGNPAKPIQSKLSV